VEGSTYDAQTDGFTGPTGKLLPFESYDKQRESGQRHHVKAAAENFLSNFNIDIN
jgi:hypothetical protein